MSGSLNTPSPPPPRRTSQVPQWREAVAGAAAGAISRSVMAPIERIKLLQQLQYSATTGSRNHRMINDVHKLTAIQIAAKIYREEGLISFWRGNLPNILRVAGTQALNFTGMDYYKRVAVAPMMEHFFVNVTTSGSSMQSQQQQIQRQRRYRSILTSFISGGLAGATATTVLYPFEFVRTRLAMDRGKDRHAPDRSAGSTATAAKTPTPTPSRTNSQHNHQHQHHHQQQFSRQYTGMMDVIRHIFRNDGIFGFYQGYGVALVGGIIYRILYLGGYDACKAEWLHYRRTTAAVMPMPPQQPQIELTWTERFVMAQMIALLAGTMIYPFDSVRRRMMMQAGIPMVERIYTNSIHCTASIWRQEGIRGFYLGLGPNLVRSVGGALILVGYDGIRTFL